MSALDESVLGKTKKVRIDSANPQSTVCDTWTTHRLYPVHTKGYSRLFGLGRVKGYFRYGCALRCVASDSQR